MDKNLPQDLSRREFNKSILAGLGGGAIALLFGGASGGSSGELDPFAVLKDVKVTQAMFEDKLDGSPLLTLQQKGVLTSFSILELLSANGLSKIQFAMNHDVPALEMDFNSADPEITLSQTINLMSIGDTNVPYVATLLGWTPNTQEALVSGASGQGGSLKFSADAIAIGGGFTIDPLPGDLASAGDQVGLPTSAIGSISKAPMVLGRHRHAFSGRFTFSGVEFNALLPGGAFPDNFARIKINNNWTLRRIWVFTKNGPTGGTETYGIVTAGGVLQGVAVVLPASAGAVSQAESALQVTNLTGGTLYYLAQTASTAVIASTNVEVGIEYTMNV